MVTIATRDRASGFTHLLDHKTGKVKNDYTQLKSFAMWEFLTQPDIHTVKVFRENYPEDSLENSRVAGKPWWKFWGS